MMMVSDHWSPHHTRISTREVWQRLFCFTWSSFCPSLFFTQCFIFYQVFYFLPSVLGFFTQCFRIFTSMFFSPGAQLLLKLGFPTFVAPPPDMWTMHFISIDRLVIIDHFNNFHFSVNIKPWNRQTFLRVSVSALQVSEQPCETSRTQIIYLQFFPSNKSEYLPQFASHMIHFHPGSDKSEYLPKRFGHFCRKGKGGVCPYYNYPVSGS